ncbi:NADH-quinone oxidoreductase subunit 8 [Aquisphaera giovannonii]|uniref:NADH-quinone oxidoreductase subunit H n=1 Tax=Aquisphaera giovannonii TaxID=406548 RepID=A0A5B9VZL6_9BACT|nr:NADH-quinone oxidoreductase subunit NuoH [Aquisphaera giovannonii]QEH33421.1 NADH-quinone oxidoreductase subunit 8 [Aquisphaera giovannonii]
MGLTWLSAGAAQAPTLLAQQPLVELDRFTIVRWLLWLLVGFFGVFPGIVAYMVWLERKVAARFQDRIGPNRVGPLGLLQPIADAIKLITKEDIVPRSADRWAHLAAPVLVIMSAFLVMAVIPFAVGLAPVDLPSGMAYLIAVSSISPLGIFLAGWSSRNKYSLLGAMRAVAQLVSYEVPQVLSTIPIVLWAGSLSLVTIFDRQVEYGWFLLSPPGFLAFMILLIASIAEVNRTPFDLPEAESEIIAGYHTEYSSMRFGLFFLAEYLSVFAVSCLATVLFLGGGTPLPFVSFPVGAISPGSTPSLILADSILVAIFLSKVLFFIFVMFWVRATLPRMRVDRLMNFSWKYLVPLSIANVLIAAVWYEMVIRPGELTLANWLKGVGVTGLMTAFLVSLVFTVNRRIAASEPLGADWPTVRTVPQAGGAIPTARP